MVTNSAAAYDGRSNREEGKEIYPQYDPVAIIDLELEPCVTGKEPLDQLIDQLEAFKDVDEVLGRLKDTGPYPTTKGVPYYQHIEQELKDLGLALEVPRIPLSRSCFFPWKNTINENLVNAITAQAKDLYCTWRPSIKQQLKILKLL